MTTKFTFLHGFWQGSWIWDEARAALSSASAGVETLALDVPGCGRKRSSNRDVDLETVIASFIQEVDAAGHRGSILVGHSMAGALIPTLLAADPGLFRHVVYVSCLAPIENQTPLTCVLELPSANSMLPRSTEELTRERLRAMFCNDMGQNSDAFLDKLGLDHWPDNLLSMSGWEYNHLSDAPSTYVRCLSDTALPPIWQDIFANRLQVSNIIDIDAGHQVMNSRPLDFARLLLQIDESHLQ